jgi:hypothetical protein
LLTSLPVVSIGAIEGKQRAKGEKVTAVVLGVEKGGENKRRGGIGALAAFRELSGTAVRELSS